MVEHAAGDELVGRLRNHGAPRVRWFLLQRGVFESGHRAHFVGAPLRLIAPQHYGYKSVKHLARIEFRRPDANYRVSGFRFMDYPRARGALEERGRGEPGWLLRVVYRPLISGTVARFARAMADHEKRASTDK